MESRFNADALAKSLYELNQRMTPEDWSQWDRTRDWLSDAHVSSIWRLNQARNLHGEGSWQEAYWLQVAIFTVQCRQFASPAPGDEGRAALDFARELADWMSPPELMGQ